MAITEALFSSLSWERKLYEKADCALAHGLFVPKYPVGRLALPRAAPTHRGASSPLGAVSPLLQTAHRSEKPLFLALLPSARP